MLNYQRVRLWIWQMIKDYSRIDHDRSCISCCYMLVFCFFQHLRWIWVDLTHDTRQNSGEPVIAQEIRQQTLENFLAFKAGEFHQVSQISGPLQPFRFSAGYFRAFHSCQSKWKLQKWSNVYTPEGNCFGRNHFPGFGYSMILLRPLSRLIWRSFASDAAILLRFLNHLHVNTFQRPGCCTQFVRALGYSRSLRDENRQHQV